MILTRRDLLKTAAVTAGTLALVDLIDSPVGPAQGLAAASPGSMPTADECRAFAEATFSQARTLGCAYADLRITRARTSAPWWGELSDSAAIEKTSLGIAVRVRHSGAWGFAERRNVTAQGAGGLKQEIARLTAQAVADAELAARQARLARCAIADDQWVTPRRMPRSPISVGHQRDFRRAVNAATSRGSAGASCDAGQTVHSEETYFVSTAGAYHYTTRLSVI